MSLMRWRGNGAGVKSDFDDGRNFVDENGAAYDQARYPGSVPGTYDDVLFDAALEAGALSPAGYDGTADEKLASFRVGAAFDGGIASSGTWLQLNVDAVDAAVAIKGTALTAPVYLKSAGGSFDNVLIEDGAEAINLDGTIDDLVILKGTVELAATAIITTRLYIGMKTATADATVTIKSGATLPETICAAGTVTSDAATASDITVCGLGTWTQNSGDLTGVVRVFAGTFNWNGGNISDLNVYAGIATAAGSALARTLTTARVYTNGTLNLNNGLNNIVLTNPVELIDGVVYWATRRAVD